jgi:nitrate/nitrite transporter NarK
MTQLFKVKLGMVAVIVGIIGAMSGVGGVEASTNLQEMITGIGVAVTSLMLLYVGTLLVKEEI